MKPVSQIDESDQSKWAALEEAINLGFHRCAAEGYEFTSVSRFNERFGRSLQEHYPDGSQALLRFAASFWTLSLVKDDVSRDQEHCDKLISHLLSGLELDISSVFFPSAGLGNLRIPINLREQEMRRLILASGARIGIEEFIKGNPILSSISVHGKRSGCVGSIALLSICVVIIICLLA